MTISSELEGDYTNACTLKTKTKESIQKPTQIQYMAIYVHMLCTPQTKRERERER